MEAKWPTYLVAWPPFINLSYHVRTTHATRTRIHLSREKFTPRSGPRTPFILSGANREGNSGGNLFGVARPCCLLIGPVVAPPPSLPITFLTLSMARRAGRKSPHRSPPAREERPSGGESEDEYEVERLLAKRTRGGRVEYLIKWLGYPESESTWQAVDTMNCPELIAAFEREHSSSPARSAGASGRRTASPHRQVRSADTKGPFEPDSKPWTPGDWEDAVDSVDTVTRTDSGQLHVWLLWRSGELSEELAEEANVRCPQKVIEFYQSRLKFPGDRR